MPHQKLTETLEALRNQLAKGSPLDDEDRKHLEEMLADIQSLLDSQELDSQKPEQPSLGDRVSDAVGRFEISHPDLAAALSEIAKILRPL